MATPVTQESDLSAERDALHDSTKPNRNNCFTALLPIRRLRVPVRDQSSVSNNFPPLQHEEATGLKMKSNNNAIVELCPSMDLMVAGSRSSLGLYRTMTPHKLSAKLFRNDEDKPRLITQQHRDNGSSVVVEDSAGSDSDASTMYGSCGCCWRSDGRVLAVVIETTPPAESEDESEPPLSTKNRRGVVSDSKTVQKSSSLQLCLYAVEDMMTNWQSAPTTTVLLSAFDNSPSLSNSTTSLSCLATAWTFVGAPNAAWTTLSEEEVEAAWCREHVHFPVIFPPSAYHASISYESNHLDHYNYSSMTAVRNTFMDDASRPSVVLPSSDPLSLFALVIRSIVPETNAVQYQLTALLHGRYPWIVNLPLLEPDILYFASSSSKSSSMSSSKSSSSSLFDVALISLSHRLTHAVIALSPSPSPRFVASSMSRRLRSSTNRSKSRSSCSCLVTVQWPLSHHDSAVAANLVALEHHLRQLEGAIPDIVEDYRASLHPLHQKLEALVSTLDRYGIRICGANDDNADDGDDDCKNKKGGLAAVSETIPQLLASTILSYVMGTADSQTVSALEQYFASVQFNDQLLTRMVLSVYTSMANVESSIQAKLVSCSHALLVQTSQLVRLNLCQRRMGANDTAAKDEEDEFVNEKANAGDWGAASASGEYGAGVAAAAATAAARRIHRRAQELVANIERLKVQLIEARFVVREWVQLLRSVASTVKAKGTSINSTQHQQALQRRVPDAVVNRILGRLAKSMQSKDISLSRSSQKQGQWTEEMLLLTVECVLESLLPLTLRIKDGIEEWRKQPLALVHSETIVNRLVVPHPIRALTTRLGAGGALGLDEDNDDVNDNEDEIEAEEHEVTFWVPHPEARALQELIVVAMCPEDTDDLRCCIDLLIFPLVSSTDADFFDDKEKHSSNRGNMNHYEKVTLAWNSRLQLEGVSRIVDVAFYGDNGKSTLSSMDGGTGKERRQALSLIVETTLSASVSTLELWLVNYDTCRFSSSTISNGQIVGKNPVVVHVRRGLKRSDSDGILYARSRVLGPVNLIDASSSSVRLAVSGSRGVGTVVTEHNRSGTTILELFDFEDDEDNEEGSDDMSD